MYVVEVKIGKDARATAERRCRSKERAVWIAAQTANAGTIYIHNPELNKAERYYEVESVRVYDTKNPDIDIDF